MNLYNVIYALVPQNTDMTNLPAPVQEALDSLGAIPLEPHFVTGTRIYQGKGLLGFAVLAEHSLQHINDTLPGNDDVWNVIHMQPTADEYDENGVSNPFPQKKMKKADVINWAADVPVFDGNGNQTGTQRPSSIPALTSFCGTRPVLVPAL